MRHKISSRCIAFDFTSHAMRRRRNGWERLYRNRPWRSQLPFVFRPDLDLADDEASQRWNAHKALRTLPALLNIKDTACQIETGSPTYSPGWVGDPVTLMTSSPSTLQMIEKPFPSIRMAQMSAEQRQAAMEAAQRWKILHFYEICLIYSVDDTKKCCIKVVNIDPQIERANT